MIDNSLCVSNSRYAGERETEAEVVGASCEAPWDVLLRAASDAAADGSADEAFSGGARCARS